MTKIEEEMKGDFIRDTMLRIIRGSETVALQAVDSAATVMKAGLDNAEQISIKTNEVALNAARRCVKAGTVVGNDINNAVVDMAKGAIKNAVEMTSGTKGAKKADTEV
jgi:hypothetical protein